MNFEFTDIITIEPTDLRQMYSRVKKGEIFSEVFDDIMSGYDDEIYYNRYNIKGQVYEEILRRLNQNK